MTDTTTAPTSNPGVPLDTLLDWTHTPPPSFSCIEDFWNLEQWLNDHARRLAEAVANQLAHNRYSAAISQSCTIADICLAQTRLSANRHARYGR